FSGYYLEYERSGCSVYADREYLVRNYDSHPHPYEGRYIFYQPTDGGYATLGPSMQVTGRVDGMNEKGLVMAYNFTHRKQSADGFLCNMIGRLILETCKDVTKRWHFFETFRTDIRLAISCWILPVNRTLSRPLQGKWSLANLVYARTTSIFLAKRTGIVRTSHVTGKRRSRTNSSTAPIRIRHSES